MALEHDVSPQETYICLNWNKQAEVHLANHVQESDLPESHQQKIAAFGPNSVKHDLIDKDQLSHHVKRLIAYNGNHGHILHMMERHGHDMDEPTKEKITDRLIGYGDKEEKKKYWELSRKHKWQYE